jgi:hypothetical protein
LRSAFILASQCTRIYPRSATGRTDGWRLDLQLIQLNVVEVRSFVWNREGLQSVLFENSIYKSVSFQLEPEDIVVACSDGVIETENENGELWAR